MTRPDLPHVVVGAGFTGLAAAYELARSGRRVVLLEQDSSVGGLAGGFEVEGAQLEKFYHHWFTNDVHVLSLLEDLGVRDRVVLRRTRTGMFHAQSMFKLSNPLDVLRFTPLRLLDRVRLGMLVLHARRVRNWRALDGMSAEEWIRRTSGDAVFRVVWEPLLRGKFGPHATDVSAVWFWNKLKLRGGSRGRAGGEQLAYYRGGFAALAERLAAEIRALGGEVRLDTPALALRVEGGAVVGVETACGPLPAEVVLLTPALPVAGALLEPHVGADYAAALRRIDYLANVCLVLELERSLSSTYWLNVADPSFPFVGVIEHTNFEPSGTYGGRHIVYLSKYLPETAAFYRMSDRDLLETSIPHLQRMFPAFSRDWILRSHVWRARFAQPVVVRGYSRLIPEHATPVRGVYMATMAQIYPEDRGTNYAIRDGRRVGLSLAAGRAPEPPAGRRA